MKYADIVSTPTPQSKPLNERQVKNNAGGFVYEIDKWDRLDRFLILGSDSQTYYQTAHDLTRQNAKVVLECYAEDAARTVARIVEISDQGRAPKNDPAIFALALGASYQAGDNVFASALAGKTDAVAAATAVRQLALGALPKVCRTSTHLFQFVKASKALGRGFGRAFKRAVSNWYADRPVDVVAYQAIKYRQREGFTHKRLLDMSHSPAKIDPDRQNLYHWIKGKEYNADTLPAVVRAHLEAMNPETSKVERQQLIAEYKLPWEALPTECNADPDVWASMLPHLGLTALIRNLGNMTRVGAIKPLSDVEAKVVARLNDETDLRKSRIHPFAILQAMAVYKNGQGLKGSGTWTPSRPVVDALDNAFYKTFKNVEPTNKRHLLALDVSGSMGTSFIGGVLSARDATAALALVTMNVEPNTHVIGFTAVGDNTYQGSGNAVSELSISPRQRLTDAIKTVTGLPFGATDCALPMLYAAERNIPVDVFTVFTDNETWHGNIHPSEALKQYRKKTGIPAKLVVVGMTSTGFSIADPNDGGCLDIVGFDSNCPALISDFARQ